MFGSIYYKHPEILLDSLKEMSEDNKKKKIKKSNSFFYALQKIYVYLFGVPEIGFQLRNMYFQEMLKKNVKKRQINKILDAGSGIGAYTLWLSKKYNNSKVMGGEIDEIKLNFTKKFSNEMNIKNVEFEYLNLEKTISRNNYDLVVNIDVLEHVKNYKQVLRNFHKLISPGGILFIHTPQPNQRRIFSKLQNWHHDEHVHEGFDPESLKKDLKAVGFKTLEARETFGFFGKLAWELNHLIVPKGFILLGITYPFLYLISRLDLLIENKNGLGTAIIAKRQ